MNERTSRQLRLLSNGSIAYGAIGLVMAVVLLGVVFVVGGRLDGLAVRLGDRLGTVAQTLERTAVTLERAGATSLGFGVTVEQAVPTLVQVDVSLGEVGSTLRESQAEMGAVNILGQRPLAALSDRLGRVATTVDTLRTQVSSLGVNLAANKANLVELGTGLTDLAAQIRRADEVVASGEIESSLGEVVGIVRLSLALLAIWFA
ncbi:MAG: hypothetical protein M3P84_07405, partial [Chloroflexota bacterium]|nr:hypothetical protein [Chloroflexota bacterium]